MRFGVLLIMLLAGSISLSADVKNGTFTGKVIDQDGAVIPGTRILIRWDPWVTNPLASNAGMRKDMELVTNDYGTFSSELPPGFYDVFVSARSFQPHCAKVYIQPGENRHLAVKLKLDPESSKYMVIRTGATRGHVGFAFR